MEQNEFNIKSSLKLNSLWMLAALLGAVYIGKLIAGSGMQLAVLFLLLPIVAIVLVAIFLEPRIGLLAYILYCFFLPWIMKHFPGPQYGLAIDMILVLTWLGVIFYRGTRFRWRHLNNDLIWLAVAWFALSTAELANPTRPSFQGWIQEIRGASLYWLLATPLSIFLFNKKKYLQYFLNIIIALSLLGALYAIKQSIWGVDASEQLWLDSGAKRTHILFGKLRVFSYYTEAAQFGASQAQLAIMCFILSLGPYSSIRKLWYAIAAIVIFYGMMLSGTRGAMGAIIGGGLILLILSKKIKILIISCVVGALFIGLLKYTHIGNDNDQIRRLRSALNPNDPSLLVRLENQQRLKEILKTKPFGTGVGTIGMWGAKFNKHLITSTIPHDSLFVKNWVMYGVIGLIIWLGSMLFITGKSAGIIWKTRDPVLRNQLTSLCAGTFGLLVCSYGNEVITQVPSSTITYISWAFIWLSPRWDMVIAEKSSAETKTEPSNFLE